MNGPAITAVVLAALALIVIGFVVTLLVLGSQTTRWRNTTEDVDGREVIP